MLIDEADRSVSFAEFQHQAERVAAGLQQLGITDGSVVAWQLPTRIETIVLSLALSRLGAVQNPIIHLYRKREVASLLRTTGAGWFVQPGVWKGFDYRAMVERSSPGAVESSTATPSFPKATRRRCRRHPPTATPCAGCTPRRARRRNRKPFATPTPP